MSLTTTPSWDDVPQWDTNTPLLGGAADAPLNRQAQALANRTELLKSRTDAMVLTFANQLDAVDELAILSEGQRIEIDADETRGGHKTRYVVSGGTLSFVDDLTSMPRGYSTLAEAESAAATLPDGQVVEVLDVRERYEVQGAALVYQGPLSDYSAAFAEARINAARVRIDVDYTVRIPKHFPDLQSAFDHIEAPQTSKITILIEAGHALKGGLRLNNGDYSNFTISSEDAVVKLAPGFAPVPSPEWPTGVVRESILVFFNCRGPVLNCLIDGELKTQDINGLLCGFGGDYKVLAGAGVKGMRVNLEARECAYHGSGSIWDDAFEFCARFTSGVMFSGRDSSYRRSFRNPTLTSDDRSGGVLVSRGSYGTLQDSTFEGHPYSAISVRRSHVNMIGVKFMDSSPRAIAFWDGAIVVVNSETLVDGVQIAPKDINLGGFNGIFKSGMCLNSSKNPIEITSNASGTLVRYADGFAQVISPDFTVNMSTAEGQGFKSPIATWDYSSLVSLGDDRRQISAHLTTTHIAFPVLRALSASRVNHSIAGFISSTGVAYRVVVSGYWGNNS